MAILVQASASINGSLKDGHNLHHDFWPPPPGGGRRLRITQMVINLATDHSILLLIYKELMKSFELTTWVPVRKTREVQSQNGSLKRQNSSSLIFLNTVISEHVESAVDISYFPQGPQRPSKESRF